MNNIALKIWILTKSFAFNIFRFLKLSYLFVIIHGRYIAYKKVSLFIQTAFKSLKKLNETKECFKDIKLIKGQRQPLA